MRKLLTTLLLLCLCSCARAQTYPYREETILSGFDLTPAQQAVADHLYYPLLCGEEEIRLPLHTRYEDAQVAMLCLSQDYPELFNVGHTFGLTYFYSNPEYAATVVPAYRMDAEEAAALRSELYLRSYLLADQYSHPFDLHDALCSMVVYGGDPELRHTAVGAILQGQATCEGYAQALTLLYRMAGIPCGTITGTVTSDDGSTGLHAWNMADIDGFTLIDATWNDQDRAGFNTHWYFGLSTEEMATSHTPDERMHLPPCSNEASWLFQLGHIVHSETNLDICISIFSNNNQPMNMLFMNDELYQHFSRDPRSYIDDFNRRIPQVALTGSYGWMMSDDRQCMILFRPE